MGISICVLGKMENNTVNHLFVSCAYTTEVWKEISHGIGLRSRWNKTTFVDCLQEWLTNKGEKIFWEMPCICVLNLVGQEPEAI